MAGGNKKVVSNIKSLSTFPVSDAANAATAVSRKRSLADRILFEFSGQVLFHVMHTSLFMSSILKILVE